VSTDSAPFSLAGFKRPERERSQGEKVHVDARAGRNHVELWPFCAIDRARLHEAAESIGNMPMPLAVVIRSLLLLLLACAGLASPATAAIEVSFYSKEFGSSFPHAFVTVRGVVERSGETVDTSYGFTAKRVTPAILMGAVGGEIVQSSASYIANSDRHFSLTLSDEEYDRLMAVVESWRNAPQPSYHLNRRNCVYFVASLAAAIGMNAETPKSLMKKPFSYVQHLLQANRDWLQRRRATLVR
jgi:hypothetical protein